MTQLQTSPRGTLHLTAPVTFGSTYLVPAIAEFQRRHPRLLVDLDLSDHFVDLLEDRFDLAVRIGDLRDTSHVARRLGESQMLLCASPAYLERHGRPRTPRDLERHECLIYSLTESQLAWTFSHGGKTTTVDVHGRLRADSGEALRAAAVAGAGIVPLPDFIVGDQVARGALEVLLPKHRMASRPVHAVYPHRRYLSAKVRLFVDFLVERFTPPPWRL